MTRLPLKLNRQASEFLNVQTPKPPIWERTIEQWRVDTRVECITYSGPIEDVELVEVLDIADVGARLYRPRGGEDEVFVWIHGGGWAVVDLDCCDALARVIANRSNCAVLAIDYRRAPEHNYPSAVEDCWEVVNWAARKFARIAVGGDSAGGNLAAAVARRATNSGITLALQALVYPVLECGLDAPNYERFRELYDARFDAIVDFGSATITAVRYLWNLYAPNSDRRFEPDASPLRSTSFSGLPPTLMITAEHDIFRVEDEEYVKRLASEGIPFLTVEYPGQMHGFFHLLGLMADAQSAVREIAAALRSAMDGDYSAFQVSQIASKDSHSKN